MSEYEFLEAIRQWLDPKEWVVLPQVRNQTGFARKARTADAIAISTFPSKGIGCHGFEFKSSRTDWLKELKDGSKSEEIGRFCSRWSLAVSSADIVRADELPVQWGLLVCENGSVKVKKKAPFRDAQDPTWPFFASLCRSAQGEIPEEEVQRRIAKAVAKARDDCDEAERIRSKAREDREKAERRDLVAKIQAFRDASGIDILGWEGPARIGKAVRFVLDGGLRHGQLEHAARSTRSAADAIDAALAEVKAYDQGKTLDSQKDVT